MPTFHHVGAQWLRTGFQTRVTRVRLLPPMLFSGIHGYRLEQLTTGHSSHFLPGQRRPGRPSLRRRPCAGEDAWDRRLARAERARAPVPGARNAPGTSPAVGQWLGHLIWDEDDGGSSPSSWTRRPQDALLPAERAPRTCPATEIRTTSGAGRSAPVAQPERAPAYEAGACRFKSCRACCVRG